MTIDKQELLDLGYCPCCKGHLADGMMVDSDCHGDELEVEVLVECAQCGKRFTYWGRYQLIETYCHAERN